LVCPVAGRDVAVVAVDWWGQGPAHMRKLIGDALTESPAENRPPKKSWTSGFAAFYEALTGDFRGDVPMYLEMAKRHEGPILELACGTGRVAIPLAEAGSTVVGLDSDPEMLALAESKSRMLDLRRRISFVEAEMESFKMKQKFPLIIAGANSLIHLLTSEKLEKCLVRCREQLDKDGTLYIAFEPSPYLAAAGKYRVDRERPRQVFNREIGETLLYRGTTTVDPNFQLIVRHHEYANPRAPHDATKTATFNYSTRPIYPGELEVLMKSVGLEVKEIYGDYDLRLLTRQSEKIIYRIQRA
jgi:SAM-dependent methyltransferase